MKRTKAKEKKKRGRAGLPVPLPAFEKWTGDFLTDQDIRHSSRGTYERGLRRFLRWIVSEGVSNPDRQTILAYKRALETEGLSPLTSSGYLTVVRKLFEWLEAKKMYPNVARGVKGGKKPKGFRKDPLTVDQARDLLSSIDRSTLEGKRNFAIIILMLHTALRTIEIIRANVEDIRQEGGEAALWIHGKGRDNKDEAVLLTPETLFPIRDYLAARGPIENNSPLFVSHSDRNRGRRLSTRSVSRIVKELFHKMGMESPRLTAHSLRHTAITFSLMAGANIQEAQALARHADIKTTLIYAHNIDRFANAPERKIAAYLRSAWE